MLTLENKFKSNQIKLYMGNISLLYECGVATLFLPSNRTDIEIFKVTKRDGNKMFSVFPTVFNLI